MSDTPLTDSLLLEINEGRTYETVGPITELARTLERHHAKLRAALQKIALEDPTAGWAAKIAHEALKEDQ
jgi:hypothetical protein